MKENVSILISKADVQARVKELAAKISKDYAGKTLYLICVLKGGVVFMVDLARELHQPVYMNFMDVSSYDGGMESSGHIKIVKDLDEPIEGLDVLIVEDIVDSGRTLQKLKALLWSRNPASLRVCALLDKPTRRVVDVKADYTGFKIPDEFVVGYGLDYDQRYRNLDFIGVLSFIEEIEE